MRFHDVHTPRSGLSEERLSVIFGRAGHRPDAASRAVPREPEHRGVTGIDRPHQRHRIRICLWHVGLEHTETWILADVPQSKFALSDERRCRFPIQEMGWVRLVHRDKHAIGNRRCQPATKPRGTGRTQRYFRLCREHTPRPQAIVALIVLAGDNPRAFETIGGKCARGLHRTAEGHEVLRAIGLRRACARYVG